MISALYGHPGNLGVTKAAEQYFRGGATYREVEATIGVTGEQVPIDNANLRIYRWQNGELEMHFRNDHLTVYSMNGRWVVPHSPVNGRSVRQNPKDGDFDEANVRKLSDDFYNEMQKVLVDGGQVAADYRETNDLTMLRYYLKLLRLAIDKGNWNDARRVRDKMASLPLVQRSFVVAADAPRRIEERRRREEFFQREVSRMNEERRHQEEMWRLDKIQQDQMQWRREIIDAIRYSR